MFKTVSSLKELLNKDKVDKVSLEMINNILNKLFFTYNDTELSELKLMVSNRLVEYIIGSMKPFRPSCDGYYSYF